MWRHLHCFLGAPLIHRDHLAEVWTSLLEWAANSAPTPWWIDLSHQPAEGPLWHSLLDVARERRQTLYPVESFHRACLVRGESFESYCRTAMSAHCRQELRRKRRRLGELGRLELRALGDDDDLDDWTEHFLELESRGWKGRETSALASDPAERRFFENFACGAFARQRLHLLGLFLDGRPIAMKCNLFAAPGSFSFKIAFDESLAKYSPGVLLEWDNTQWLLEQSEIEWMDSCAKPGHFMIGQLWKHCRQLQRVLIPTTRRGDLALGVRPLVHALRRGWKAK
jgi:CelD/BcsL family acetyltransferase involved in cellulose biosynthesis